MKPLVIVLEGPDGAGKSTLAAELAREIRKSGSKCHTASFPGKIPGSIGNLIYRIHHNPREEGIKEITGTSLQALHIAAHIDFLERTNKTVESILILDRFWWSTIVYGRISKANERVLQTLVNAEKILWKGYHILVVLVTGAMDTKSPQTIKLESGYHRLAKREKGKYPILQHNNVSPVKTSANNLFKLLRRHINHQISY